MIVSWDYFEWISLNGIIGGLVQILENCFMCVCEMESLKWDH